MSRLIYADALLKDINDYPYGYRGMIKDTIARQPTVDAVEVVRCKDCVHFWNGICKAHIDVIDMDENDFCSLGEREDEID